MPMIKFLENKRVIVGSDRRVLRQGTVGALTDAEQKQLDAHDYSYIVLDDDVDPADVGGVVDSESEDYQPGPADVARELRAEGDYHAKLSFVTSHSDEQLEDKSESSLDQFLTDFIKEAEQSDDEGDDK